MGKTILDRESKSFGRSRACGRGRNTRWSGGLYFDGGVVQKMTPVNRWNHDTKLELLNGREIHFQATTSGNFGGLELVFESLENIKVEVKTNLVTGLIGLAELGLEDHTLEAGGLERKIRFIRLPDELTQCSLRRKVKISQRFGIIQFGSEWQLLTAILPVEPNLFDRLVKFELVKSVPQYFA